MRAASACHHWTRRQYRSNTYKAVVDCLAPEGALRRPPPTSRSGRPARGRRPATFHGLVQDVFPHGLGHEQSILKTSRRRRGAYAAPPPATPGRQIFEASGEASSFSSLLSWSGGSGVSRARRIASSSEIDSPYVHSRRNATWPAVRRALSMRSSSWARSLEASRIEADTRARCAAAK